MGLCPLCPERHHKPQEGGILSEEGARLSGPKLGLHPRKPTRAENVQGPTQYRMERRSVVME